MPPRLHPFNHKVGAKVRNRRMMLGWSQRQLAERTGLTFQQIQKYENGVNRIDPACLMALSAALGVPPAWFFGDLAAPAAEPDPVPLPAGDQARRQILTLARAFNRIADNAMRERVVTLVEAMADADDGAAA
ncbi:MAG: helix-turn-helix transcriptional regulator [Alphaproteobacteria bacterium]|jgi:transcriptional regulator with XRE-family HTH domain|nr:helix-turn-helix transcriptional regulator [Alphaproteobacteria bacterium]